MESYEDSVKKWENYVIDEADILFPVMKMYNDSSLKTNYDFILKQEAELIKKICGGQTTFVRVFTVYYYLLWNGFFSKNNYFEFNKNNNGVYHMPGLSIIMGSGVCLNIATHFCDILKYINDDYRSYAIGMHLDQNYKFDSRNLEIKKNCRNFENPARIESDLLNHANALIISKDDMYVVNLTNFLIYKVVKSNKTNLSRTRVELRAHISLNSNYSDINELKRVANDLKILNDELASWEYIKCDVDTLSKVLNTGVMLCKKHMREILAFRKKYDYVYETIPLNIRGFSTQINDKVKTLKYSKDGK